MEGSVRNVKLKGAELCSALANSGHTPCRGKPQQSGTLPFAGRAGTTRRVAADYRARAKEIGHHTDVGTVVVRKVGR